MKEPNEQSIKVNMLMNIVLTASNFIFPLITYSYVAHILLSEGTGKVSFVQSVTAFFGYIASLGVDGYGLRETAKVRNDRDKLSTLCMEILSLNLISTGVSYLALAITIAAVAKFHDYSSLFAVMSLSLILQTLGMEWLYKGLEKYTYITVRSISIKILAVILTLLLVRDEDDVFWYAFVTVITTSSSYLWNFINIHKYIDFKKVKLHNLKRHFKPIMIFFMSTIITTIYGHFDTVMLGFMKDDSTVGIYNAAGKIMTMILSVSTAVTSVLIPRLSIYSDHDEDEQYNRLLEKSFRVTCLLMWPLVLFVMMNTEDVILFVCGEDYLSGTNTLRILMLCCCVLSMTNFFGNQILIPKGNEKRYSVSVFGGMWINLGMNACLIPFFSSAGAAIATLGTEFFNMIYMGLGCKKEIRYVKNALSISKYIGPLSVSGVANVLVILLTGTTPLLIRLVINACTLFGTYYIILFFTHEPLITEMLQTIKSKLTDRPHLHNPDHK